MVRPYSNFVILLVAYESINQILLSIIVRRQRQVLIIAQYYLLEQLRIRQSLRRLVSLTFLMIVLILPARTTKNKTIIKKVRLTPIENKINIKLLTTLNWRNSKANTEINTACVTANKESLATLTVNHEVTDAGITVCFS